MKKKLALNSGVALLAPIIKILLGFFLQREFIFHLGVNYNGYNSVFTNILQMLNMADLGVGIAVTSYLYKPIAEKNKAEIKALMFLYKKIYQVLGIIVLIIGCIITIILPMIINDAIFDNNYLRLLFVINLIGTVSSYFLAYHRTLTVAEERSYFTNSVDMICNIVCTLLQIILLYILPNYVLYLVINVLKNVGSNAVISIDSRKKNRYLREDVDKELVNKYKSPIWKYVKDVFVSRIGAFVFYGTDNIVISIFKGSLLAGYLSNYTLITVSLQTIITQVFSALQATLGNVIARNEDNSYQYNITNVYFTINYILANITGVTCCFVFQYFMQLYLGKEYLLSYGVILLLCINLIITIVLITPSHLFIIYRLYKYDKPIILVSASLNIIISCLLVRTMGIAGVLIGTLVTSCIYLFSRLYIIAKKVFFLRYVDYLKRLIMWGIISCFSYFCCYMVSKMYVPNGWLSLILYGFMILFCSILSTIIPLLRSKELRLVKNYLFSKYVE